ncbi:hypothetical protein RND71_022722 [Anisodus tanguticus]|uniref:Uncharacterized protein n=1 Tax=Anisodus tanguticus TaxID=243964 RepID=A0AAE1V6D6_9SOLA|nr:hypothetical protein RND71_022722 [Anisodus tanguticus]
MFVLCKYHFEFSNIDDADGEAPDHAIVMADVYSPARYTKNIEFPAPFSTAISNIGVFNTELTVNIETIVPTYPEGTENEGCSSQDIPIERYRDILPHMKNAGIPLKSIDIHDTTGTTWWTFKVEHVNNRYQFAGIFPPVMYTLSCQIAQMFIVTDGHGTFSPIVTLRADDLPYQTRLVDIGDGGPFRAFAALCGGSSEEWNEYANIY